MENHYAQMVKMFECITSATYAYKIASDEHYEYSEPHTVGGPQGLYRVTSPYAPQTGVQWAIDTISDGASQATLLVSNEFSSFIPGVVVGDTGTSEFTPIKGLLISSAGNGVPPIRSFWYDLTDSSGTLYLNIKTAGACYLTIQFRHRRK